MSHSNIRQLRWALCYTTFSPLVLSCIAYLSRNNFDDGPGSQLPLPRTFSWTFIQQFVIGRINSLWFELAFWRGKPLGVSNNHLSYLIKFVFQLNSLLRDVLDKHGFEVRKSSQETYYEWGPRMHRGSRRNTSVVCLLVYSYKCETLYT